MTESLFGSWINGQPSVSYKVGFQLRTSDVHLDVNIVARDDRLTPYGADLDFDVDDAERLCANVDLHEAGVDRLVELAEA